MNTHEFVELQNLWEELRTNKQAKVWTYSQDVVDLRGNDGRVEFSGSVAEAMAYAKGLQAGIAEALKLAHAETVTSEGNSKRADHIRRDIEKLGLQHGIDL